MPAHGVGASEQDRGLLDAALREALTDAGRIHVAVTELDLRDDRDREAEVRTQLGQRTHRPLAIAPVAEVVADVDFDGPDARVQDLAHEALGGPARKRAVERLDDRHVGARLLEQLELLVEGREQLGRVIGAQHAARMRLERVDRGLAAERVRALGHGLHDALVPEVQTVEVADRQDAPARAALRAPRCPVPPALARLLRRCRPLALLLAPLPAGVRRIPDDSRAPRRRRRHAAQLGRDPRGGTKRRRRAPGAVAALDRRLSGLPDSGRRLRGRLRRDERRRAKPRSHGDPRGRDLARARVHSDPADRVGGIRGDPAPQRDARELRPSARP